MLNLLEKRVKINNQIQAAELRVIDAEGGNLGVMPTNQALLKAKEAELDLIEISPGANPPVAKIMDYGKYHYIEEKKARETKKSHQSEMREIRVGLNTSERDLQMKAKKSSEFLDDGDRVKIEIVLKGRAKYLDKNFIYERLNRMLNFVTTNYKIVDGPKKGHRGYFVLIEKE